MSSLVVFIHSLPLLVPLMDRLSAEMLPDVQRAHIVDEPLLIRIRRRGHLDGEDAERLCTHICTAQQIGADAALVTCSTLSPCVDQIANRISIPTLKIEDAMVRLAVATGHRIGIVATIETAVQPTLQMLLAQAEKSGKQIRVESIVVQPALASLMEGDAATHDHLVRAAVLQVMERVDAVVLAQASMARVLDAIPAEERKVPVLSSPSLALQLMGQLLAAPK